MIRGGDWHCTLVDRIRLLVTTHRFTDPSLSAGCSNRSVPRSSPWFEASLRNVDRRTTARSGTPWCTRRDDYAAPTVRYAAYSSFREYNVSPGESRPGKRRSAILRGTVREVESDSLAEWRPNETAAGTTLKLVRTGARYTVSSARSLYLSPLRSLSLSLSPSLAATWRSPPHRSSFPPPRAPRTPSTVATDGTSYTFPTHPRPISHSVSFRRATRRAHRRLYTHAGVVSFRRGRSDDDAVTIRREGSAKAKVSERGRRASRLTPSPS